MNKGTIVCVLTLILLAASVGPHAGEHDVQSARDDVLNRQPPSPLLNEDKAVRALDGMDGCFIRNVGQIENGEVLFYARGAGLSVGFTRTGIIITVRGTDGTLAGDGMSVVRLDFVSCNWVEPKGVGPAGHRTSFILGGGESRSAKGAEGFSRVVYEDLYDGIDLNFRFEGDSLKYDLVVGPLARVEDVLFHYRGADSIEVDPVTGDLMVGTAHGMLRDPMPTATQTVDGQETEVPVRFSLEDDGRVRFELPEGHDGTEPLLIDPGLQYATHFGGVEHDQVIALNLDGEDYVYVSGFSQSSDFPVTPGTYDNVSSNRKVFIAKLSPKLDSIVFCTYVDTPQGVDNSYNYHPLIQPLSDGSILFVHSTAQQDFPVTDDAYCTTHRGEYDMGVLILSADGSELVYSSFVGGSGWDFALAASMDDEGALYIAGETDSPDLPVTSGAYCTTRMHYLDSFVLKMPSPYRAIEWCTLLGGSGDERIWTLEVNEAHEVLVTGPTDSPDFPVTTQAYQPEGPPGSTDSFIVKLDPTGSRALFSTYVGGEQSDESQGIVPTASGGAYVVLYTSSMDFPVSPDAADKELGGTQDVAIYEVDGVGRLLYSTYLGGSAYDIFQSFGYDSTGRMLYMTVMTTSRDFPTVKGCYSPTMGGFYDIILLTYDLVSKQVVYSTYYGGTGYDSPTWGPYVKESRDGYLSFAGSTDSSLPTTQGALYTSYRGGGYDGFIVTIDPRPVELPAAPTGLALEVDDERLNVSWDPLKVDNFVTTGYNLYYGTSPDDITHLIYAGKKTRFQHQGLDNGARYYYQVTVNNSAGEGPRGPVVSGVPMALPNPPLDLVGRSVVGTIELHWSPPEYLGGGSLMGYDIMRGADAGEMSVIDSVGASESYVDDNVTVGSTYFYAVAARNERGVGVWSGTVSVKARDAPNAPTGLVGEPGTSNVTLTWGPPSSDGGSIILGYRIYRGQTEDGLLLWSQVLPIDLRFVDLGLVNGVTYHYAVSAFTAVSEGPMAGPVAVMPRGPPGPPLDLSADPRDGGVGLSWSMPGSDGGSPVTGYKVRYGTRINAMTTSIELTAVTTVSITGLENGVEHFFSVSALNEIGEGVAGAVMSTTPYGRPGVPTGLTAVATEGGIALAWVAPSDFGEAGMLHYWILRRTTGNIERIGTVDDVTAYLDATVSSGTTYEYMVQAFNDASEGEPSSPVSVLMPAVPGAPMGISAAVGLGQVLLWWTAPLFDGGSPIIDYVVLRGSTDRTMVLIARVTILELIDRDVEYGETYYYAVQAMNAVGMGATTPPLEVTPLPPPGTPRNLTVELKEGTVVLTWEAPTGQSASLTGYDVLRGGSGDQLTVLAELGLLLTFTDKDVERGRTYYYSVVARSEAGDGEPASPVRLHVREGAETTMAYVIVIVIVVALLLAMLFIRARGGRGRDVEPNGTQKD